MSLPSMPTPRRPAQLRAATLVASALLALPAAPVMAQGLPGGPSQAPVVVGAPADKLPSVNGKAIPKARVEFMVRQRAAQGAPDNEEGRRQVMDELINREVLAQEADKKGLARRADTQTQLDMARQQILIQALFTEHFKANPIKEDAMRAEYNRARSTRGDKEYKARHILVEKESEAKEIIEQLKKGGKFEELAKQSKDPGSKDRGGDLDWNPPATFVKTFSDALVKLDKGKVTDAPVQTQFGWHVIRLDDVRNTQFPPYDEVKPQITRMLQEQEIQKLVKDLRGKAKVE